MLFKKILLYKFISNAKGSGLSLSGQHTLSGGKEVSVIYGAQGWKTKELKPNHQYKCDNTLFGDPIKGCRTAEPGP